jgi:hypothetical protein
MRLDEVSVSTGLLHDVVEDTLVDLDTLRSYFGSEITQLVDGLTKIAQISDLSREKQQAENVRKMVLAMITDVRVVLIKLADRLHNMRTMQFSNLSNAPVSHKKRSTFMHLSLIDSVWVNFAANSKTFHFKIFTLRNTKSSRKKSTPAGRSLKEFLRRSAKLSPINLMRMRSLSLRSRAG